MAFPRWLTPAGNLGVVPELEYYEFPLDAYDENLFAFSGNITANSKVISHVTNLDGILNLIDCIQDFAVDVVGLNPIDVFDFELEENREDIIKPNKLFDALEPVIDVIDVIERKKQGIDCTEAESAEIKGYLRELKLPEEQQIVSVIQLLFPIEYGEFLDEV